MTADADLYCNGARIKRYHDHHVVAASYLVHSRFGPLSTRCKYRLYVREKLPIRIGGRVWDRIILTDFFFYIAYV